MGDTLDLERRLREIRDAAVKQIVSVGGGASLSVSVPIATLSEALAAIEALRKDAERLDWLDAEGPALECLELRLFRVSRFRNPRLHWHGETAREAIDLAIDASLSEPTP